MPTPRRTKPGFAALVGDGPEGEKLKSLAQKSPLAGRYSSCRPWRKSRRPTRPRTSLSCPSVSEGLSNALLEAMASGLAVLGSRVGGTVEAVEEGKTGLLFAPQDADEFSKSSRGSLPSRAWRAAWARPPERRRSGNIPWNASPSSYEKLYAW